MKSSLKLLSILLFGSVCVPPILLSNPAIARNIKPVETITVSPGYGVTIITAEPIYKLWIDDGSQLGVDFDRPPEEGATIFHVYQESKASSTFSADGNTMMTLVSGNGDIQKIQINFSSTKTSNNILDLSNTSPSATFAALNPNVTKSRLEVIRTGLSVAVQDGLIQKGGSFYAAIQQFIRLLERGDSLEIASQKTGVVLEVIGKLAKLGVEEKGYQLDLPDEQLQVDSGEAIPVTFTLKDFNEGNRVKKPKKIKRLVQPDPVIESPVVETKPTPSIVAKVPEPVTTKEVSQQEEQPSESIVAKVPDPVATEKESPVVETKPTPSIVAKVPEPVATEALPVIENVIQDQSAEEVETPDHSLSALSTLKGGQKTALIMQNGLQELIQSGDVQPSSQKDIDTNALIRRVKWGESPRYAASQIGLESAFVNQLLELGASSDVGVLANPHKQANALVRGLATANRTGEIGRNARLSWNVQNVVRKLRRGSTLNDALLYSGVTQQNAQRLLQLGNYSP